MNSYDQTYIAILGGFVYLAAIMDTWSRRIVDYALVAPWPSDTGSRRLQPHDPTHTTSQNQVLQQPLGAQDQKRPRQGPQTRPRCRQGRPPCHHERPQPTRGALSRPPLRRRLGARLPKGRRLPAKRPRRPAHMLPIQNPSRTQAGQNHKRHRTTLPRSPAQNMPHGYLPAPNLNGPNTLRRLHTRK